MTDTHEDIKIVDVLLEYLRSEGVTHLFGVPGAPLVPLYEALKYQSADHPFITPINSKHECGASYMADGYARASRRLGVCCATSGPGATNALTGVACAYSDSIPVLIVSAQVSTAMFGKSALQDSTSFGVDLVEIYKPVTKLSVCINDATTAPRIMERAMRTAFAGRPGPVHLNLPVNVARQRLPKVLLNPSYKSESSPVEVAKIDRLCELLTKARQPCILAGHGVNIAGAWGPLLDLAERLQIPVATTQKAKGAIPEMHPLSLGVFGFAGKAWASDYVFSPETDLLLVLGSSLGEWQTRNWDPRMTAGKTLVQIDIDENELGKNYPLALGLVADVGGALSCINRQLSRFILPRRRPPLFLQALQENVPQFLDAEKMVSDGGLLKPQQLIHELQAGLPDDTLLFLDSGNCICWYTHYFQVRQTGTFFTNQAMASMGYAGPASIGGKLARPDRPVVALMGDGAFAMNGLELHTAVEYRVPVVWIVLNDGGYGMVEHGDTLMFGRPLCPSRWRVPLDVCAMAEGMGARGFRVNTAAGFSAALAEALQLAQPCLIDARIDPREVPLTLSDRIDDIRSMMSRA